MRLSRANRRVLLVLLTGAEHLGGYTVWRLAGGSSGTVQRALWNLKDAGWVETERGGAFAGGAEGRLYYSLSPEGRSDAMRLLGLEVPGAPPAMMPAPVAEPEGTP